MSMIKAPDTEQHAGIGMPTVYIRRVTLDSVGEGLGTEVQLVIKDLLSDPSTLSEGILKHLRIHVYQSRDPSFDVSVKSKSKNIYLARTNRLVKKKTISIFDYLGKEMAKESRQFARFNDASGKQYEDYVYRVRFDTEDKDPQHLSYFAQAEIDMESVSREEGIKSINPSARSNKICGKLTGEAVISRGAVSRESTFYSIKSPARKSQHAGAVWAGPVHRHSEGGYMAGAKHTNLPHASLNAESVINPKVLDMRGEKHFEEKKFLFDSDQSYESGLPKDHQGSPIRHDISRGYCSELFVTKTDTGAVSLTFSFDHLGYIQNETRFRDMISSSSRPTRFLPNFPITNLQIIRHQVDTSEQEIVMDTSSGNISRHDYVWPPPQVKGKNRIPTTKPTKSNSLEMINVVPHNAVKTWTIVDNDSFGLTVGKYKYEAVITIEDRTFRALESSFVPLENSIRAMRSYEDHAATCGAYSPVHDQFDRSFKQKAQKFGWIEAIATFATTVETLYGSVEDELVDNMVALANPATGTPAGITHVIGIMTDLGSKINDALGDQVRPPSSVTTASPTGAGKGSIPQVQIRRIFDEIYDADFSDNGLTYLNERIGVKKQKDNSQRQPVKRITKTQYSRILKAQREKYFSGGSKASTKTILKGLAKGTAGASSTFLSDAENTQTLFLTPTAVHSGPRVLNLSNQGEKLYDMDQYSTFTADLLNRSGQTRYVKVKNDERSSKELSQLINGIFASEGISVDFDLLDRNVQKGVLREVVGTTNEGKDDYFIESSDILDNDRFRKDNIRNNTEVEYSVHDYDERENLINELGKEMLSQLATDSRGQEENRRDQSGFKLALAKLDPENNVDLLSPSRSRRISRLPMQVLSLIFSRSPVVRKNWHDLEIDLLQDGNYTEFYRYNYDMVVKVQFLDGYAATAGRLQLRSPVWKDLTYSAYKGLNFRKHSILCRLEPHQDNEFGLGQTKNLDVPIYNKYFILEPESSLPSADAGTTSTVQQVRGKVNKFMSSMTPAIVDYARTITIDHSDMFGVK